MRTELLNSLPTEVGINGEWESRCVFVNDEYLEPYYSQKIRNHSPDGFNWGYGGSGPAQFALALLMEFLPIKEAQQYYMAFKFKFIAGLPQSDFKVTINLRQIVEDLSIQATT